MEGKPEEPRPLVGRELPIICRNRPVADLAVKIILAQVMNLLRQFGAMKSGNRVIQPSVYIIIPAIFFT
jgi:hypothetical protein